ncbi:MAG: PorV/PorQ family protein [Bacteroidota bacterium]
MRSFFLAILAIFFVSAPGFAQKYSNEFLSIGVGARAAGMGNSLVAGVDDVTGGYWNPAGLMGIKSNLQVSFMHSEWFAGIGKFDYFSFAAPINDQKRVLGFSFIRFGIDNIPNTLSLYEDDGTINYSNVSPFSAADYALLFSYAQNMGKNLRIGGNVKVIHHKIGPFANSWGFGLDLGLQYHLKSWRFGLLGKDITSTFNAWNFQFTEEEQRTLQLTDNEVPESSVEITKPQFVLGIAYQNDFKLGVRKKAKPGDNRTHRTIGLLIETDFNITTDGKRNVLIGADPISIDPAVGMEFNYNDFIFIRGGINNFQKSTDLLGNEFTSGQPTGGIGVKIFKVRLDYALTNLGDQQENFFSHLISLTVDINFDYIKNAIKNAE